MYPGFGVFLFYNMYPMDANNYSICYTKKALRFGDPDGFILDTMYNFSG